MKILDKYIMNSMSIIFVSYDDTIFSHLSFTIKFRPIEKK